MITEFPPDGGMLYAETDLSRLFPEPLNAISSLFFLVLAGYWIYRLFPVRRQFAYLFCCSLLLLVGAIGGSVYHGFRLWWPFIVMDWLPIMLLCVSTGVYFFLKLVKWYVAVPVYMVLVTGLVLMRRFFEAPDLQFFIDLNYAVVASLVVLPILAYLVKTRFRNGLYFLIAFMAFGLALFFRIADSWKLLTSGTHFLWHSFGAVATGFIMYYIFLDRVGGLKAENAPAARK